MVQQKQQPPLKSASGGRARIPYDGLADSLGLPIYGGYSIADPKALDLAPWPEWGVKTAFLQLEGMPTICESRITEIAAGSTSEPMKQAVSEIVYVLDGQGTATLWAGDGPKQTFEWQKTSLFILPRNTWFQLSSASGSPARLLSYNHRPLAMTSLPDFNLHFKGPLEEPRLIYGDSGVFDLEPKLVKSASSNGGGEGDYWNVNLIPQLDAWDNFAPNPGRGAGGKITRVEFPAAEMNCHLSAFGPGLYKKAHKHGGGRVIVVTKGEGYAVLTPFPGMQGERQVCQLEEGSIFVPPDNWYHQHFNTGSDEIRLLVMHPLRQFSGDPYRHQIEYPDEEPWVRETFAQELAKKGRTSAMPPAAYENADFKWPA